MSLRAFHIVFVVVSTALAFFVGVWAVGHYSQYGASSALAIGVLSLGLGLGLVAYGFWFLRKVKLEDSP